MYKVSFIIPSYNSFKTISKTLNSIFRLSAFSAVHEIIVVDCSDDVKTRQILKCYDHPKLKVIELSQKISPAGGRNTGAVIAVGELLCFIDSDVFLDTFWLEHIFRAYRSGCRAGGGSVGIPYFQKKNFLALAQLYLQFNETLQAGKTRPMAMVPACNMFVERRLFEKVGGFPQLRASEDVVFCLKYASVGSIWFVPNAHCFHIFRDEKKAYFRNQIVLGKYISIYRRMIYKKWYYKKPWVTLLLPCFVLIKTAKITGRIMNSGCTHLLKFILTFPLFLIGLFYWAIGFYQGSQKTHMAVDS